jgi:hypothetical protein
VDDFDSIRREWQFERMREEHRECCCGATPMNGRWVNIIAGDGRAIRRWDESLEHFEARFTAEFGKAAPV